MIPTLAFPDAVTQALSGSPGPLIIPWPMPGNLSAFVRFDTFMQWHEFMHRLGLRDNIPQVVAAKFKRAQKLHLLGWIDLDVIKAGELVALTALELALKDCYGPRATNVYGNMAFAHLLRYLPEHDGLTDDKVPMNSRCGGGTVMGLLTGERKPSLAQIRNDLAHGYPFDGFPRSGLLELVRDLIEYAYREIFPPPEWLNARISGSAKQHLGQEKVIP
jgi:hypothetical protein